jgi:hypothetical protein
MSLCSFFRSLEVSGVTGVVPTQTNFALICVAAFPRIAHRFYRGLSSFPVHIVDDHSRPFVRKQDRRGPADAGTSPP